MTDISEHDAHSSAPWIFSGLAPTRRSALTENRSRHVAAKQRSRLAKGLSTTVPIFLVGSMAMTMNLIAPVEQANAKPQTKPKATSSDLGKTIRDALAAARTSVKPVTTLAGEVSTAVAPSTYRVAAGDTISGIAGRFALSTASVLALNGLGWSSLIFPGQQLKLSNGASVPVAQAAPPASTTVSSRYTIAKGDTISRVAAQFGVSTQSVLTANGLSWSSIIYPGQTVAIPGQAAAAAVPPPAPVVVTPAPTPAPVVVTPPAVVNATYVIASGDTITRIAVRFGISSQALLTANGLSYSSIIYSGRTLVIPGIVAPAGSASITLMNDEMRTNAAVIVQIGQELGVSDYGLVVALAAAMQESSLRNINWGDRDSVGLFQQRPSTGWGTVEQILDASHASRLFFGGPSNPNKGYTRGLLDISGWESMTVTQAAQRVQISAYPNAYAKWEASARAWLAELS